MGCKEFGVWCDVECVVCCGKYGVFSVTERKLEDSKRLGFDGIVYKTTHTHTHKHFLGPPPCSHPAVTSL